VKVIAIGIEVVSAIVKISSCVIVCVIKIVVVIEIDIIVIVVYVLA